jgi:hypothetical protein
MSEEARQNREYYQEESRKTGKPWYKCPKSPSQYSELVEITPEVAVFGLADGELRLSAISLAGVNVPVWVSFNVKGHSKDG